MHAWRGCLLPGPPPLRPLLLRAPPRPHLRRHGRLRPRTRLPPLGRLRRLLLRAEARPGHRRRRLRVGGGHLRLRPPRRRPAARLRVEGGERHICGIVSELLRVRGSHEAAGARHQVNGVPDVVAAIVALAAAATACGCCNVVIGDIRIFKLS